MPWTLTEAGEANSAPGIAGYAVYEAVGVRLGYVSGWVMDDEGRIRMLKVAVTVKSGTSEYLVPVGAIKMIADSRNAIHLHDLTKDSIARRCFHFKGDLPERRLLLSLHRHFPPPSEAVAERLRQTTSSPLTPSHTPSWIPLSELSSQ